MVDLLVIVSIPGQLRLGEDVIALEVFRVVVKRDPTVRNVQRQVEVPPQQAIQRGDAEVSPG
ncbi:MAG: hypothetical protein HY321_11215 [Armatimonadetes bacterium]|nr:hypothetical protein [Armatimonadota bacterium]